jgi:hypothetical protein
MSNTEDVLAGVQASIEAQKSGLEVDDEGLIEVDNDLEDDPVDNPEDDPGEPAEDDDPADTTNEDREKAMEHGWKPYDEYIEEGGDPDMYRGAKAFNQYKVKIDQVREAGDSEVAKLKEQMSKMSEMFVKDRKRQADQHRQDLEVRLKNAKEEMDVDKVHELTKELAEVDDIEEPEQEPEKQTPKVDAQPLQNLINSTPVIDHTSPDFDPDVAATLQRRLSARANKVIEVEGEVTAERMKSIVDQEWEKVQEKFNLGKKRPQRRAPNTNGDPQRQAPKKKARMSADEKDMYEFLKETNPEAAKDYYQQVQERS